MPFLRSLFLAGLVLYFAAQQALCACAMAESAKHPAMTAPAAHDMPAGHACDEAAAPEEHDTSTCPHCSTDSRLVMAAVQAVPAPIILPAAIVFLPMEASPVLAARPDRIARTLYHAHGPPRRAPLQMKTRFLN